MPAGIPFLVASLPAGFLFLEPTADNPEYAYIWFSYSESAPTDGKRLEKSLDDPYMVYYYRDWVTFTLSHDGNDLVFIFEDA